MYTVNMLFEHCFHMGFEVALRAAIHIHHALAHQAYWKRHSWEEWSYIYILSHFFHSYERLFTIVFNYINLSLTLKDTKRCHSCKPIFKLFLRIMRHRIGVFSIQISSNINHIWNKSRVAQKVVTTRVTLASFLVEFNSAVDDTCFI